MSIPPAIGIGVAAAEAVIDAFRGLGWKPRIRVHFEAFLSFYSSWTSLLSNGITRQLHIATPAVGWTLT